jgi:hypothetical protein
VIHILHVVVHNVLDESVRVAIIKMSRVFQRLCAKEVRKRDAEGMMLDVVMATCLGEGVSSAIYERYDASTRAFGGPIVHVRSSALSVDVSNRTIYENIEGLRENICTSERQHRGRLSNG